MIPGIESLSCGPLAVPDEVMEHVVRVESSFNPFAIGVVGGRLQRQPTNRAEAEATMRALESGGRNYSVGLAQVNRANFARFNLKEPHRAFDACSNLRAGASILAECLERSGGEWGPAFSCYYSGNETTGYEHGYVQKVFASMQMNSPGDSQLTQGGEAIQAIRVLDSAATPAAKRASATLTRATAEPRRAELKERAPLLQTEPEVASSVAIDPARVF